MPEKDQIKKPQTDSPEEPVKVGVYTCYCGGNISDTVQCEAVAQQLKGLSNVMVSRTNMSMCSDAGQAIIEADIREHGLNRIVIGACAPSLHEKTFRKTVERAGLNPYLYQHVGIREQDSWVHHNQDHATEKAVRLMSAGIAKARLLDPLAPIELRAEKQALVIGGGVAGLRAAYDIARRGLKVALIEKEPFLGGRMAQLETVFPTGRPAREELDGLLSRVTTHPNISIYLQTELVEVKGYVGDFQIMLRQRSRGVAEGFAHTKAAIAACPVEVPDEFNFGRTTRKAIYQRYDGCYPSTPAIDWEHCTRCGECLKVSEQGINLEDNYVDVALQVGAIVVATGFRPYEPRHGEFGYGEFAEVVTLPELIRLMALQEEGQPLTVNNRPVRNAVLVHCVGSRQIDGIHEPQDDGLVNEYCSRVCCTATLHVANELRTRFPTLNVFDLYEDIRTYGRGHEEEYRHAGEQMVRFLRFDPEEMPEVVAAPEDDTSPLLVRVTDHLTWEEQLEIPADLVVLAVGMMPNPISDLIELLKVAQGTDRFLLEVHPKLRPVETAVPGVVLAGTAQGPMNIQESCAAAEAAAAKVAGLLGQGLVELEPFKALVNPDRCDGSGECAQVCAYEDAITIETMLVDGHEVRRAVVTPANCAGCGACVAVCPNRAIDIQGWTLDQYEAMVDAIAADIPGRMVEPVLEGAPA
ncbi:MAG: CoB--CoM heterodisulfide reductase iron-sulfur subunit A family protein [Chloroflexota bacterium]